MAIGFTFKDGSKLAISTMESSISYALQEIGLAAQSNIKGIILEKDIYDTGALHDSIDYDVDEIDQKVDIGSDLEYAIFNELGTVRMRARPFIKPGITKNMSEYREIVSDILGKRFKIKSSGLSATSYYYSTDKRLENNK